MSTYTSGIPHALQFQHPGQEVLLVRTCRVAIVGPSNHDEKIIDVFPDKEAAVHWLHREYGETAMRRIARFLKGWRGAIDEDYGCIRRAAGARVEDTYTTFNV